MQHIMQTVMNHDSNTQIVRLNCSSPSVSLGDLCCRQVGITSATFLDACERCNCLAALSVRQENAFTSL
ncbi:hypothetical protein HBH56_018320 [Parastagonospora nodorum]|uniref:Uncharacterized protein n=1 Tax=Phaeosphaeria nodorum (strain SN15 / ATCC MYA-4574 / FGSC 10173) TaxID=321614 RepID=A0A7U2EY98_PHANO|nr:hypothetical protein HBH56_018320 [Parastagonospora nodorum]QRC95259.1 hypothetical protein JI435_302150 [Parastagonospora nodorum SN15]KAH3937383.1 hypothetical protein HBH54_016180 [Parastagonospora nodorum]KAH3990141.1 hypothetical protein HBH52_005100 [Parastagonospora nodorum]KAH4136920.1 hypothetical protein HBH45_124630 [Parastagonospora nodorum]